MTEDEHLPEARLRIGELAALARTTTRAIRHYEAIGLLPKPERDESGYRRYGSEHVVMLVRIRRLRALDMPLDQIAAHVSSEPGGAGDLPAALRSLADDIGREVAKLERLRAKALDLAASSAAAAPVETWQAALRAHGLLGDGPLPAKEHAAVNLLDSLHPAGVEGVVAQASGLMSDPALIARLAPLLDRFRHLAPEDAAIDALAAELAAVLPRPDGPAPSVDLETMDKLVGDRFTEAQRRCLHRLRGILEGRDR